MTQFSRTIDLKNHHYYWGEYHGKYYIFFPTIKLMFREYEYRKHEKIHIISPRTGNKVVFFYNYTRTNSMGLDPYIIRNIQKTFCVKSKYQVLRYSNERAANLNPQIFFYIIYGNRRL